MDSSQKQMRVNITAKMALTPDLRNPTEAMSIIDKADLPKLLGYLTATARAKTVLAALKDRDGNCVGDIVITLSTR